MKVIRRIIVINIISCLFLISAAYAEYPTSTPQMIESIDYNFTDGINGIPSSSGAATLAPAITTIDNGGANTFVSSSASTITWTGGGNDNLASNPANWSSALSLQNGDGAVFDGTSSKNCSWDQNIILSSLNINLGYTGTVTITADLTIDNGFTWTGNGSDNLASNPANWSGGVTPRDDDDVDFDGTEDCVWDVNIVPASLRLDQGFTGTVTLNTDLSIAGGLSVEGGSLNLNDKALNVDGDLLIGANGTLYATSSTIKVKGDWINYGIFNAGTSTVIFNGINQTIYGDNTFYNLIKISGFADTLYFEAGSTQTILNNLVLQGTAGNLLSLRSTIDGQYWQIDPQGTRSILFTDVKDMDNLSATSIVVNESQDSGHNDNIGFGGSECARVEKRRLIC